MKYRYLLFDLDGTIFDYDRAEAHALEETFTQFNLVFKKDHLTLYRDINKQIWADYENGIISQNDLSLERFGRLSSSLKIDFDASFFSSVYLKNLSKGRYLIPGAVELLELLFSREFKLYLITNGLKDVQRERLSGSPVTPFFKDIFISEEMGAAKPDRKIFDESFNRMGSPEKSEVLIIGDSLSSDIAGGFSYGIDTCWINPEKLLNNSNYFPTFVLESVNGLREILKT
ncbi:MAG: YjjG family noncanonical pyrimidine nucleotidase [Acidobacteriota bacterium]